MKNKRQVLLVLLVFPVILACSFTTLLASTPAVSQKAATLPPSAPATDLVLADAQVRQTISGFLGALQAAPDGAGAEVFLAPALQQSLAGGSPARLLGGSAQVAAFQLSAVTFSPDALQASVDVTVEAPQAVNLRFALAQQSGSWLIENITLLQGADDYPAVPEAVVQAFLTAYQETPDQMSHYLSARRLVQLPPGGAVAMLNINGALEGSMIESAAVGANPPVAVVETTIQAGGSLSTRRFVLVQDDGKWKIDTIEAP